MVEIFDKIFFRNFGAKKEAETTDTDNTACYSSYLHRLKHDEKPVDTPILNSDEWKKNNRVKEPIKINISCYQFVFERL